jgi:hypothetical protein
VTHVELRDRLGDWIGANSKRISQAVRTDILNIAQKELCRQWDLSFNEQLDTFDTVAGQNAYDLPSDFSRPYEMQYLDPDSQGVHTLSFLLLDEFDNLYPDPTKTAKPGHYTTWSGQLYLGKTPDQVLTIHRAYYRYLPDLSADGDHTALTDKAWEVLLFKALGDMTRYGLEDERIPVWQARGTELELQMVREHARAKSAGRRPVGREP